MQCGKMHAQITYEDILTIQNPQFNARPFCYSYYSMFSSIRITLPHTFIIRLTLLLILIILSSSPSIASCYSFLPYAYNGLFVHLPKNAEFCVSTPDGEVLYKTNANGARIITGTLQKPPIHIFGDSQMIEIFPSGNELGHALKALYGDRELLLHGAPNNGPTDSLHFIESVLNAGNNIRDRIMVIGLNIGADIFRIIPGWRTRDHVPTTSNYLDTIMTFPFLYELLISIELIRGNSIRRVDGANQRSRARIIFLERAKEITKSLKFYLDKLNVFKRHHNLKIDLVIFPPFWLYDVTNPGEIVKTNQALLDLLKPFLCNTISGYDQSFEHIFFAEYADNVKSDTFFTYDERHFMNKPKQFLEYNSFCTP